MQTWTRACLVESVSDIPCRSLLSAALLLQAQPWHCCWPCWTPPTALLARLCSRMRRNLYTQISNPENSKRAAARARPRRGGERARTAVCVCKYSCSGTGGEQLSYDFSFSGATFNICLGLNCLSCGATVSPRGCSEMKRGTRKDLFWLLIFIHKIAKNKTC